MKVLDEKKYNHIELNNEVTKRDETGFYQLGKDQEALQVFKEEVEDKTIHFGSELERLHYLVDNDFYYDLFEEYSEDAVMEIVEYAESIPFEFKSYMAASKFFKDYTLKTNDKKQYLEDSQKGIWNRRNDSSSQCLNSAISRRHRHS